MMLLVQNISLEIVRVTPGTEGTNNTAAKLQQFFSGMLWEFENI